MSVTRTVFAVSLCMFAAMWTASTLRIKADISVDADGPNDDEEGCVPVSAELGSRAIGAGDVILEEGASASSILVKTVSGFDMSHVMMVASADTTNVSPANQLAQIHVWVVESLEEGVKGRWLWNVMFGAASFRVHRLKCGPELAPTQGPGVCKGDWDKTHSFLNFHAGGAYGYSRLVKVGFEILWQRMSKKGRILENLDDPCPRKGEPEHHEDFMCSEIVWGALQHGGFLPKDIESFKGMSPKQLEECALAGKRENILSDTEPYRTASKFMVARHVPWHKPMRWKVSEPQAWLGKDMVISFLQTLRMDRRMTFSRWLIAAEGAGHPLGQKVEVGAEIQAKHAYGLFTDSKVTGEGLMDGLLDAFIILELTENFNQQCQTGSYMFLNGVGFAAPKLEIMSAPFCKHGSLASEDTGK